MTISALQNTMIFREMTEAEIAAALKALAATEKEYQKGELILHAGSTTDRLGLVLRGSVTIENNDIWGNRTLLSRVERNQFFAETYGVLQEEPLLVDVVANEDCRILFLRLSELAFLAAGSAKSSENAGGADPTRTGGATPRPKAGTSEFPATPWAVKLMANLLVITARKNLVLSERSFHTAPRTIRGKVLAYLNSVALRKQATEFDIPLDRQQMADYLNVDRTALSKELGRMREDGLIRFRRNHFLLMEQSQADGSRRSV